MICPLMTCVVMMGKVFTEDVMEKSEKHDISISPKIVKKVIVLFGLNPTGDVLWED